MLPEELVELFRRQHGVAAGFQICRLAPERRVRRRIYGTPELEWASPRVVRHRAAPWSIEQDLMCGVLDAGPDGILWGKSAAAHWGFGRFPRLPAHVAVPRRSDSGQRIAEVHLIRSLDPRDSTIHLDIPIARPESVVLWLAGMWTHRFGHEVAAQRTAVALDQAWRQRLIDGRHIRDLADRCGGRGRSGIVVLRELLEERPPGYLPAGSRLEERFEEIVPSTVRRELRRQVTVDIRPVIRTVDFELDSWPLIVEINGEAVHSSLTARQADSERYDRLLRLGYSIVIFWESDIWYRAELVCSSMRHLAGHPDATPTLHRPTKAPWEW